MFNAGVIAKKRTRSLVAPTHVGTTGLITTSSVSWPVGYAIGDLGLVYVETNITDPTVTSSGWTKVPGSGVGFDTTIDGWLTVYYKIATSLSEPAFTISAPAGAGLVMSAWRGVDQASPFNALAFVADTITSVQTGENSSTPAVTTTVPSCVVIVARAMGHDFGTGSAASYITTTRVGQSHGTGTVGGLIVGDVVQASPGSSGIITWAWDNAPGAVAGNGIGMIAIQPQ